MKIKRTFTLFTAFVIFLTGCNNASSKENVEDFKFDNLLGITYMNNGMLYNDGGILKYFDVKSALSTPICSLPECMHKSSSSQNPIPSCPAAISSPSGLAYIGDKLWFFTEEEGDKEETPFKYKTLFQANKDGLNKKRAAKIEAENISAGFYTGDSVIVSYQNTIDWDSIDNIALDKLEKWTAGIYVIGLSDAAVNEICVHTEKNVKISNLSFDGTNIYYVLEYFKNDIINATLYKYNTETKKTDIIAEFTDLSSVYDFNTKGMVYGLMGETTNQKQVLHTIAFDGTDAKIAKGETANNAFFLDSSKIAYLYKEKPEDSYCYYIYDIKSERSTKIEADWNKNSIIPEAAFEDKIYVFYSSPTSSSGLSCGLIKKDDFINGKFDKVVNVF